MNQVTAGDSKSCLYMVSHDWSLLVAFDGLLKSEETERIVNKD